MLALPGLCMEATALAVARKLYRMPKESFFYLLYVIIFLTFVFEMHFSVSTILLQS